MTYKSWITEILCIEILYRFTKREWSSSFSLGFTQWLTELRELMFSSLLFIFSCNFLPVINSTKHDAQCLITHQNKDEI